MITRSATLHRRPTALPAGAGAIGAGLLFARTARLARPASIVWALSVWIVGEGVGGMFMPGVSALNRVVPGAELTSVGNGEPGWLAALAPLFVMLALSLWPGRGPAGPILPEG